MARSGSENRKRTERETVRLTPEERAELRTRAAREEMKVPAYLRMKGLNGPAARSLRNATPNDRFIAEMLTRLTAASEYNRAGKPEDVQREHMMIRHLLMKAMGGQP